ncbi:MAG: hypothetical protein GC129_02315 [Proteobacteria bacterium]|nr:hypothetical protein [Pseudomonadota bacterium]
MKKTSLPAVVALTVFAFATLAQAQPPAPSAVEKTCNGTYAACYQHATKVLQAAFAEVAAGNVPLPPQGLKAKLIWDEYHFTDGSKATYMTPGLSGPQVASQAPVIK